MQFPLLPPFRKGGMGGFWDAQGWKIPPRPPLQRGEWSRSIENCMTLVEGRCPVDSRVQSQYNTPECVERARCPWDEAGYQNVVQEVGDAET